jgi:uncharacterized protein YjbI with pentapeptide repeats
MPNTCQVKMHDGKPCGRSLYGSRDRCLCHVDKEGKDPAFFQDMIDEIFKISDANCYDFTKFIFPKSEWHFPSNFKKTAYFDKCKFYGDVNLDNVVFEDAVYFWDAVFKGKLFNGSPRKKFLQFVSFERAKFEKGLSFRLTIFGAGANLKNAVFNGQVHFWDCEFNDLDISNTTFKSDVDFGNVGFNGRLFIQNSTFQAMVSFMIANFNGRANFMNCTFQDAAVFASAVFKKRAMFQKARFLSATDFSYAKFNDEMDFRSAYFHVPSLSRFYGNNLTKARFLGCNVKNIDFQLVNWYETGIGKKQIYDDKMYDKKIMTMGKTEDSDSAFHLYFGSNESVANLYRQLQMNYYNSYQYATAGIFHIGEQEMILKAIHPIKRLFSPRLWYKLLSKYGESYWRPTFWILVILLFVFPMIIMHNGVDYESIVFDYKFALNLPFNNSDFWNNYLDAICLNFNLVTFDKASTSMCFSQMWMRSIIYFETVAIIGLLTLLLLALRRKFKRKSF